MILFDDNLVNVWNNKVRVFSKKQKLLFYFDTVEIITNEKFEEKVVENFQSVENLLTWNF